MATNLKGNINRYMVCTATMGTPPGPKRFYIDVEAIVGFSVDETLAVTIHTEAINNQSTLQITGLTVNETMAELQASIVQLVPEYPPPP